MNTRPNGERSVAVRRRCFQERPARPTCRTQSAAERCPTGTPHAATQRRAGDSSARVLSCADRGGLSQPGPASPSARGGRARGARRSRFARWASSSRSSCGSRPEGGYSLIAGERRWRAARSGPLARGSGGGARHGAEDAFERALVENLQRADLQPDRGSRGVPPPGRGVSLHAGAGGGAGLARNAARSPTACACCACRSGCAAWSRRAACRWATRARCWRSTSPRSSRVAAAVREPEALGTSYRGSSSGKRSAQDERDADELKTPKKSASARDLEIRLEQGARRTGERSRRTPAARAASDPDPGYIDSGRPGSTCSRACSMN